MKEQIIEYIKEKIENYEAMNKMLGDSAIAEHGKGAVSALEDVLLFIEEESE